MQNVFALFDLILRNALWYAPNSKSYTIASSVQTEGETISFLFTLFLSTYAIYKYTINMHLASFKFFCFFFLYLFSCISGAIDVLTVSSLATQYYV